MNHPQFVWATPDKAAIVKAEPARITLELSQEGLKLLALAFLYVDEAAMRRSDYADATIQQVDEIGATLDEAACQLFGERWPDTLVGKDDRQGDLFAGDA